MSRWPRRRRTALPVAFPAVLLALLLALGAGGCGSDDWSEDDGSPRPPPQGSLTVELAGEPSVEYAAPRTTVVVQFIVRDSDGNPLGPDEVEVEMLTDDSPVDNESILGASAEALAANIFYALVLDASYSMLRHAPPAFTPMKEAAQRSVEEGLRLWQGRPGSFSWDLCWFNELLFHPEGSWRPDDIRSIPEPSEGASTRLYAAAQFMARRMSDFHRSGTASGPRDHHVLVILSDGADNLSWYDGDAGNPPETLTTVTGTRYRRFGWEAANLTQLIEDIRAHPRLTVHVLAMGSELKRDDLDALKAIAQAGNGRFLENPSSEATGQLFEQVTREFTTLQTRGAAIPQPPGDYKFTLRVRGVSFLGQGEQTFRYRAGPNAQLLP